ncbi:MarR family winged helix-turn-helix transcriptional regulator [Celeribacter baekdonensis]|uniref:MarR family transcriptional regulator n=1 Tax=Celeribacter baekdonensis TaxID=875171 RepID=A0A2R4M5H4_9RHOB|nr:MarR family winged helix-turn-helix transcriptional regulator [Celeribacter baekdonensis]AVW92415.1 MarR family transcriptional regulator [Celeribacter baekdonensis]
MGLGETDHDQNRDPEESQKPDHFRDTWPYFWINRVNAFYTRALEKRLKPLGVDAPRWRVLISLYQQDYMSVSEVADFSTLKLNTTTKIVQRMIADGLVETRVRPTDGRVTEVCLTEKGDDLRAKALNEVYRIRDESFHNVTPAEIKTLNAILGKITTDLGRII